MSVAPVSASVMLGNQMTFTATVTNTADTAVSWSVNGVAGGNSTGGTISSTGVYTAPVTTTSDTGADAAPFGSCTCTVDIVVVDPTTAGVSSPGNDLDLNVAALGIFSIATNSCSLGGNPVPLQRPANAPRPLN